MMKQTPGVYVYPSIVKAKTTKPIFYKKDGEDVQVMVGTEIVVDTDKSIALIGDDHVDVMQHEYSILFLN